MRRIDVGVRNLGIQFDDKEMAHVLMWSPVAKKITLRLEHQQLELLREQAGYWNVTTSLLKKNDLYRFVVDDQNEIPDPVSLSQPLGVHGPSRAIDLSDFTWADVQWKNYPLSDYILYELHTGTFTKEGTFAGIENQLDHLKELGVTAIEIMPVAQFPGERNWGYDGVFPFAVQQSYGGAFALQHLVNACHIKGLAVILDVVYNHLGPEGNYLCATGPYTTDKYKTPWGVAINYDDVGCHGVRHYFIENALMWFRDFHIDALRLDAAHAITDFSPKHILQELREHMDELIQLTGKQHYLIIEQDLNDPRFIETVDKKGYGMDAQWNDEFHHALLITAGGDRIGYYQDFDGIDHLAKAYLDAYVYDGQFSLHRNKVFGTPTNHPGEQFIVFSQNHDQVGNRMHGERTGTLVNFEMQKLLAAAIMVGPYLPMLFMGEEWGEKQPFLYFVSHSDPDLVNAVREGRKKEFAAFHTHGDYYDPLDETTFLRSKLQWNLLQDEVHQVMFRYYQALIYLRKNQSALKTPDRKNLSVDTNKEKGILRLQRWNQEQHVVCLMNFSSSLQEFHLPSSENTWQKIFDSASYQWLGPGSWPADLTEKYSGSSPVLIQSESIVIYAAIVQKKHKGNE